jgi:hypothetical protein
MPLLLLDQEVGFAGRLVGERTLPFIAVIERGWEFRRIPLAESVETSTLSIPRPTRCKIAVMSTSKVWCVLPIDSSLCVPTGSSRGAISLAQP